MTTQTANQILGFLEDKQEEMFALLEEMVRAESPTRVPSTQNKILQIIARALEKQSYYTLRVPGRKSGGYLYARPQKRRKQDPIQLLIGHCDTVWAEGTLASMPIRRLDHKMEGPGVFDMKAGIVQIICALLIKFFRC